MYNVASLGKQAAPSSQITPPESCKTISGVKIISSTPNSMDSYMSKKAMKSKPVASSTPDREISKASTSVQSTSSDKKRNFSCDISPVTMYENTSNVNDERGKVSPKRWARAAKRNQTHSMNYKKIERIKKIIAQHISVSDYPSYRLRRSVQHLNVNRKQTLFRDIIRHQNQFTVVVRSISILRGWTEVYRIVSDILLSRRKSALRSVVRLRRTTVWK